MTMELTSQKEWIHALERITKRLEDKIKTPRRDTSIISSVGHAGELTVLSALIPVAFETER